MLFPTRAATFARLREKLDVRALRHRCREGGKRILATGLGGIDEVGGGLPCGAITELVCPAPSCGGQLLLARLLEVSRQRQQRVALVDGSDAFDPSSHPEDLCRHLVWVRCQAHAAALQAADIIVRDGNFGLVVLDLKWSGERELRRTPSATWYRLQRAVETASPVLVVETPCRVVPSAQLRFELTRSFTAAAFSRERTELAAQLAPVVLRRRLHSAQEVAAG